MFSYAIQNSEREKLEQQLGKRLSNDEYNSIVNSVNSLSENLQKIDLKTLLSPTESEVKPKVTEAPKETKKPVEEEEEEIDLSPYGSFKDTPTRSKGTSRLVSNIERYLDGVSKSTGNTFYPAEPSNEGESKKPSNQTSVKSSSTSRSETSPVVKKKLAEKIETAKYLSREEIQQIEEAKRLEEKKTLIANLKKQYSKLQAKTGTQGSQSNREKYLKYKAKYLALKKELEN